VESGIICWDLLDFSERGRIMKKLACILFLFILLVGCTSKEFKESIETGNVALEDGEYGDAVEAFKTAVHEEPDNEEAKEKLEQAEILNELALALEDGTKAIEEKHYDEAIELLTEVAKSDADYQESKSLILEGESLLEQAETKKQVEEEIIEYIATIKEYYSEVISLSSKWDELRNASANGEIDDYTFAEVLLYDIIPASRTVTDEVNLVFAPSDETKAAHEALIGALEKQHQAFTEVLAAIDQGDISKITTANQLLADARKLDREFVSLLEPLIEAYGIDLGTL
jgi:tetratricopeptide (TPR) repeat protein